MNRNFAGRLEQASRQIQAQALSASLAEELSADRRRHDRARRRRLMLLGFSIVTLFSLAGMIITRAMEIAAL